MKSPELSFGNKNQAWMAISFCDAFEFLNNKAISRSQLNYDEGEVKSVHYGDILTKFPQVLDSAYPLLPYVNDEIDVSKVSLLKAGDVAIADTAEDYMVGKAIEISISDDSQLVAGLHVMACRPKINFAPGFLGYYLNSNAFHMQLRKLVTGTKVFAINKSEIRKTKLSFPDVEEQQKIAAFFTALDEKIRLSEQKLNLISKIKKGIAQKLFAQDLRFKNKDGYFFDSWKSYTVGELVDVIGGGTPSTQNPDYWDGDIYWLTPTEINSKYVHSSNRKITFDGVRNSSAKLLPKGALLLTTRATLGACSINNQDNPVCTNQGFQSLVCKDGVDNEFMYYVVTDSAFQKTMIQRASGSTFLEISSKNLKGIVIHLPSLEEQQQIATLLSSLDKKIDCLKQRVKALKTQKASFMQQMFV